MLRNWLIRAGCILNILYFEYQVNINYSKRLESRYSPTFKSSRYKPGKDKAAASRWTGSCIHLHEALVLYWNTSLCHYLICWWKVQTVFEATLRIPGNGFITAKSKLANQPYTITNICDQCKPKLKKWYYLWTLTWNLHNPILNQ